MVDASRPAKYGLLAFWRAHSALRRSSHTRQSRRRARSSADVADESLTLRYSASTRASPSSSCSDNAMNVDRSQSLSPGPAHSQSMMKTRALAVVSYNKLAGTRSLWQLTSGSKQPNDLCSKACSLLAAAMSSSLHHPVSSERS